MLSNLHAGLRRSPYKSPFRSTVSEIEKIESRPSTGAAIPEEAAAAAAAALEPLPPVSEVGATIQGLEKAGIGAAPGPPTVHVTFSYDLFRQRHVCMTATFLQVPDQQAVQPQMPPTCVQLLEMRFRCKHRHAAAARAALPAGAHPNLARRAAAGVAAGVGRLWRRRLPGVGHGRDGGAPLLSC